MSQKDEHAYLLGTETAELHRLGLQHQVWSSEARRGWELGGFRPGQTLLDLGCGPGFCTVELAYLVGNQGKVLGVDLSANYLSFLKKLARQHELPIELHQCSFDEMALEPNSLDGMFCRWALAWVPNPAEVLSKVMEALRPGGTMVLQEYYDWSCFQTEPPLPHLKKCIEACYRSLKEQSGDIDVGRKLPLLAKSLGLEILHARPMTKLATPGDLVWEWPASFLHIYPPKLVERGQLAQSELDAALADLAELAAQTEATMLCPAMFELVLRKPRGR